MFISRLTADLNGFEVRFHEDSTMTVTERRRLIGAGVRNYGFIEKAWDIARENPELRRKLIIVLKY